MRVNNPYGRKDADLHAAIEVELSDDFSSGAIEILNQEIDNLKSALAKLMEALVEKGIFNLDYVNAMLNTSFTETKE